MSILVKLTSNYDENNAMEILKRLGYDGAKFFNKVENGKSIYSVEQLGIPFDDISLYSKNEYGNLIHEIREREDLTVEEFGNLFNISPERVEKVEEGYGFLRDFEISQIASVYGMDAFAFKHGTNKPYEFKEHFNYVFDELNKALAMLQETQKELFEISSKINHDEYNDNLNEVEDTPEVSVVPGRRI
jgi:transcriptional regulator with XRE-family HTH domain